nr:nucleolar and coiled-body phosphoprotein 1-like [Aegilops tauschii subsp. strangulata]
MSKDETRSSSAEDDDKEEEEEDDSPPEVGRKKRTASTNLEAKAPKRGKGFRTDNSVWDVDSSPERPSRAKPRAASPAQDSSPRSSSEGSLDPKERASMSPPPAYSPSAKGDDEEASQRASSDRGKAPEIVRVAPQDDSRAAGYMGEKAPTETDDCPLWEVEIRASGRYDSSNHRGKRKSKNYDFDDEKKTKFFKKKESSSSKSSLRSSSKNPSKFSSNRKNTCRKAKAYIVKEMDSEEEESSGSKEEEESDEDSDSGMAGIACASSATTNFFGNPSSDDESPAYCFMAKASKEKVSSKHHKTHSSDQYSSDEDDHDKLIKIANIQQNYLVKIEKTLKKSEGLLVEEMEKNQSLTEEYSTLKSRMDEHLTRHDFLSTYPKRLTYDYLKRK